MEKPEDKTAEKQKSPKTAVFKKSIKLAEKQTSVKLAVLPTGKPVKEQLEGDEDAGSESEPAEKRDSMGNLRQLQVKLVRARKKDVKVARKNKVKLYR